MHSRAPILEETFKSKFCIENYLKFAKEFFNNISVVSQINENDHIWYEYKANIQSFVNLGVYKDNEGNMVDIIAVKLRMTNSVERARSIQRSFISKLLSDNNHDAALVAFYCEDDVRWRLSFVRLDYEFAAGKVKMNLTPAKRYSYLVGEGEPCHTAMEQLLPIFDEEKFNPSLDRIEEAFSVENVTKAFFDKYKEKYLELKEYLDTNEAFYKESNSHKFTSEQFAKKLMGQLAFLYFLQKKGWLGVRCIKTTITKKEYENLYWYSNATKAVVPRIFLKNGEDEYKINVSLLVSKEFLDDEADILAGAFASLKFKVDRWGDGSKTFVRDLFVACQKTKEKTFFNDYLEPLFYEALNHKRGVNNYYKRFNCKVPFLNGGLFEPIKNYDWEYTEFNIPDSFFSNVEEKGIRESDGILDIFDRYNFTMNEDEPLEREVAVDPEMLGKIFENLLDVNDRKSKGAFYTPREIVHYMCQESIVNYLVSEVNVPYDDIMQFVLYGEYMKDQDCSIKTIQGEQNRAIPESIYQKLHQIDKALENIRVADPSVGSGAFPLGMLSEIVKVRNNITSYYATMIENKTDKLRKFQERNLYNLKWNTIKNCIYAVDIEASAVDIAKLRLWLSLIIDVDLDPTIDEQTFGKTKQKEPRTLPNLDYNIICGNSLIDEYDGMKFFDKRLLNPDSSEITGIQMELFCEDIGKYTSELFSKQELLFGTQNPEDKKSIKEQIDEIIDNIITSKLALYDGNAAVDKYNSIRELGNKPFFIWELEFGRVFKEKGGFDVVIGNPPYIKIQNIEDAESKLLKKKFKSATGKFDIYVLFVEKSFELLSSKGTIAFIQPHRFLNVDYGKGIRTYLKEKAGIRKFIHFRVNQIFDTATTYTGIFFYSNNNELIKYIEANSKNLINLEFLEKYYDELGDKWNFSNDDTNGIVNKIIQCPVKLLDVFEGIYQGIITLGDDKFILEGYIENKFFYGKSKETNDEVKLEADLLKPVLKGENIRRYAQPHCNTYVIYPHYLDEAGKTKPIDEDVMVECYPNVYNYLLQFKDELVEKKIKYKTNPKYWYSLHRARDKKILDSEKIITPQLQNYCNFALDTEAMYPDAGGYMLIAKGEFKENLLYYYGILNSSLFYHFIKSTSTAFNNNYYYFKTAYIEPFCFPENNDVLIKNKIINCVSEILQKRQAGEESTEALEITIDTLVYKLYCLTEDEISQIEPKYNVY